MSTRLPTHRRWLLGAIPAALLATSAAWAGYVYHPAVTYNDSGWIPYMQGSLTGARESADNAQYLKCRVWGEASTRTGYCYGKTASGITRSCVTEDPNMIATIENLGPYGFLQFGYVGSDCLYVLTETGSMYLP